MQLPNIVAAGIYDSQLAVRNSRVSRKRKTTMFELELPMEDGGISHIDGEAYPIRANRIICAKPDQLRYTRLPYKCWYVHMMVPEGPLRDVLMDIPDVFVTHQCDNYRTLFTRLIRQYQFLSLREEILLQSLVLELIYTASRDSDAGLGSRSSVIGSAAVEAALRYVRDHLTETLTLERVAAELSLSPVYFHKTFKAAVGKTLRDYVEEQRIKCAIRLLQTTDYSLTQIAMECGFSSQSYFSYVFKRRMKQTPRRYAQELNSHYER